MHGRSTRSPKRFPLGRIGVVVAASALTAAGLAGAVTLLPSTGHTPPGVLPSTVPGTGAPAPDSSAEVIGIANAGTVPTTVDLILKRVSHAQPLSIGTDGYLYTAQRSTAVQRVNGPDGPACYVSEDVVERWSAVSEWTAAKLIKSTSG